MDGIEPERWELYHNANGRCQVCDEVLPIDKGEKAHKISKGKVNTAKYGWGVINHVLNKLWTCPGSCNDACNIGMKPVPVAELVDKIHMQILEDAGVVMMQHPHLYTQVFDKLAKIARSEG